MKTTAQIFEAMKRHDVEIVLHGNEPLDMYPGVRFCSIPRASSKPTSQIIPFVVEVFGEEARAGSPYLYNYHAEKSELPENFLTEYILFEELTS